MLSKSEASGGYEVFRGMERGGLVLFVWSAGREEGISGYDGGN